MTTEESSLAFGACGRGPHRLNHDLVDLRRDVHRSWRGVEHDFGRCRPYATLVHVEWLQVGTRINRKIWLCGIRLEIVVGGEKPVEGKTRCLLHQSTPDDDLR